MSHLVFSFKISKAVLLNGLNGSDHAHIADNIGIEALIDGGTGNDHLNAGRGPTVYIGGAGVKDLAIDQCCAKDDTSFLSQKTISVLILDKKKAKIGVASPYEGDRLLWKEFLKNQEADHARFMKEAN